MSTANLVATTGAAYCCSIAETPSREKVVLRHEQSKEDGGLRPAWNDHLYENNYFKCLQWYANHETIDFGTRLTSFKGLQMAHVSSQTLLTTP
jgi:hypothetical protein